MIEELFGSGLSRELIVVIASALPVTELRGSIPVAMKLFDMPWYQVSLLAVIGNMLPVPILLLFFESMARVVSWMGPGKRLVDLVFRRTKRHTATIERYERLGLVVLVAIPLPGTGAWTGSIAAFLVGMRFRDAILSIALGVIIAGAIVTVLTLLGWLGAIIAGAVLAAVAITALWKARRSAA